MLKFYPVSQPVNIHFCFLCLSFKLKFLSLCIVTGRSEDGGVMMDDLDTLQMELETLLNCVVLRSLNLQREIAGMTEKVFIKYPIHLTYIVIPIVLLPIAIQIL
jgi:hypothetical protein